MGSVIFIQKLTLKYYGQDATLETKVGNKATDGYPIGSAVGATFAAIAAVVTILLLPSFCLVIAGRFAAFIAAPSGFKDGLVGALIV